MRPRGQSLISTNHCNLNIVAAGLTALILSKLTRMARRESNHFDASYSPTRTVKVGKLLSELSDSGWFATLPDVRLAAPLSGRVEADWVVVGGGWFGANAARRIAELHRQDSVVLVDAVAIGNNAGGRCAGYAINLAHNPRNANFAEDEKGNIEERDLNVEGIAYLRDGVERYGIQCDWSE